MSTANQVAADLLKVGAGSAAEMHVVVVVHAAILQRAVVAHASGRPGPEAPTGDYRRSISRKTVKRATSSEGFVGTDKPQGRRLELGFFGEDAIGRHYEQPPYPHFGPALDEVAPGFEEAMAAIPGAVARKV